MAHAIKVTGFIRSATVSTALSSKLIAFLKTPLGITLAVILAVVAVCCCGGTVLGALVSDPDSKQPQSPAPPAVVASMEETVTPSPTEIAPLEPAAVVTTDAAPPPPPPTTKPPTTKPPAPRKTTSAPKPPCHPNYSACLPIVADLDCGEISQRNFLVIGGKDPYRLDSDNDGIACES